MKKENTTVLHFAFQTLLSNLVVWVILFPRGWGSFPNQKNKTKKRSNLSDIWLGCA